MLTKSLFAITDKCQKSDIKDTCLSPTMMYFFDKIVAQTTLFAKMILRSYKNRLPNLSKLK